MTKTEGLQSYLHSTVVLLKQAIKNALYSDKGIGEEIKK